MCPQLPSSAIRTLSTGSANLTRPSEDSEAEFGTVTTFGWKLSSHCTTPSCYLRCFAAVRRGICTTGAFFHLIMGEIVEPTGSYCALVIMLKMLWSQQIGKIERLREEGDEIKFIDFRFRRKQIV